MKGASTHRTAGRKTVDRRFIGRSFTWQFSDPQCAKKLLLKIPKRIPCISSLICNRVVVSSSLEIVYVYKIFLSWKERQPQRRQHWVKEIIGRVFISFTTLRAAFRSSKSFSVYRKRLQSRVVFLFIRFPLTSSHFWKVKAFFFLHKKHSSSDNSTHK